MNGWLLTVTGILVFTFALEAVASIFNLRALSPDLPEEFSDIFDKEKYRESQNYTQARERFSLINSSYSTLLTLSFLILGGFNWLDQKIRVLDQGEIISGLLFITALAILSFIANLPFSVYSTFVIEEKFGFNKTTPSTFILDIVKGAFLAIVLGLPLLAALLWFFLKFGSMSWMYAWLLIVAFMIVMQILAPTLIMPLFNKFSPLKEGELKTGIVNYARKENFAIQGIYTMDGSKRSTKLNAFFTGFGRFRKIVFFDTLTEKLNIEQIIAVLAHEMGHFKLKHIHKMIFFSTLQTGLIMYLLGQFLKYPEVSSALGMHSPSVYSGLLFFGILFSPASLILSVVSNIFSRKHEFEADRYGAESTGEASSLINALKELSRSNLSNLTPHPIYVIMHYSHPPVISRIRKLRSIETA